LGGLILREHFCDGMGFYCGIWIWRMGEHAQLYTSDRFIWPLHQVLPVSSPQGLIAGFPYFQKRKVNKLRYLRKCVKRDRHLQLPCKGYCWCFLKRCDGHHGHPSL
jgi:hypothetical protein